MSLIEPLKMVADLELHAEPASGGTPDKQILTLRATLFVTADMLISMTEHRTIAHKGLTFKIGPLKLVHSRRVECGGIGYLSPELRTNSEIMDGLIFSGWRVADPSDVRKHGYAISESLLARFDKQQDQPA